MCVRYCEHNINFNIPRFLFVFSTSGDMQMFASSSLTDGLLPHNLATPFFYFITTLYHLFIWSKQSRLHSSQCIAIPSQSYQLFFSLRALCIYLWSGLQSLIIYKEDALTLFPTIPLLFIVFSPVALLTLLRFVRLLPLRLLLNRFFFIAMIRHIRWLSNKRCQVNVANIRHANSYNACLRIFFSISVRKLLFSNTYKF